MTVVGSGILVGTALSVIIPEGVNAIYTNHQGGHQHHHSNNHELIPTGEAREVHGESSKQDNDSAHSSIGITLVLGFVFMFILDQIITKNSAVTYTSVDTADDSVAIMVTTTPAQTKRKSSKITATIGLIVHSAADGVALGAAASTSHTDVEMIVFLAIMLHKAPAAFGLVTFLLHEGLDKSRIKKHLLAFSLSAPLGAFVTYMCLGGGYFQGMSHYNATGIAMLFSAGTFLFVATVHVLPEITQEKDLKLVEVLLLITGSFLPSLLSVHHHH
jgi:zinc transporter 9